MSEIKQLMNIPITINLESTIADVRKIMLDKKISRVLVAENEKITSIITEKDLGLFLLGDKSDRTLQHIPSKEPAKPVAPVTRTDFMVTL